MAKRQLKVLTPEEKKQQDLNHSYALMDLDSKLPLKKMPTYEFQIGDEVALGHLHKVTVDNFNADKTIYEVRVENENGKIHYLAVNWWDIRPKADKNHLPERVGADSSIDIRYNNTTIESLLHTYYHQGVDMEPYYQRDFVWTQDDKDYLIDSIFHNIEIGRFVLNHFDYDVQEERDCAYEILDGKQRLNTLCEFYENRFPYKGLYFNDLHPLDKRQFLKANVAVGEVTNLNERQVLETFLAVNRGGRQMDRTHMKQVEQLLNEYEQYGSYSEYEKEELDLD